MIGDAIELIRKYCREEFGDEPDLSDLSNIGLAYTTVDDDFDEEHDCQVSINLIEMCIRTEIDGICVSEYKYKDMDEVCDMLDGFDFDAWVCIEPDEWDTYFAAVKATKIA